MEFQKEELNEILNIFQTESNEIISSMDEKLLALEKDGKNPELEMHLFRDAHSLKGSARMLGYVDIQNIAHKIEDVISLIKENKLTITSKITDTISECLEFIQDLITQTVANKEEFKSPETANYIKKLEQITQNDNNIEPTNQEDIDQNQKEIYEKLENASIEILYTISSARINKDINAVYSLEQKSRKILDIIKDAPLDGFEKIKQALQSILDIIERFKISENKRLSFLDVNDKVIDFISCVINYFDLSNIKRKDYYEIVEKMLSGEPKKANVVENKSNNPKIIEFLQRLPLLEVNLEFFPDAIDTFNTIINFEENDEIKKIFSNVKDILNIFQSSSTTTTHDITIGIKEILDLIRQNTFESIKEAKTKSDVIKTMVDFQYKKPHKKPHKQELSQKDILNSITNTEIKTLRIDSIKLDNLVGQIGELIVSKIKTNEQLSLAKKINNDLVDWQKNFTKMSYYIKYFDKKYLSDSMADTAIDWRKMMAYNRQLCALCDIHGEKISSLISEMSDLFRQLQESETKLNSTTTEIETMVKNMRILPLSVIFQLFPRMVHNIARDQNKKIDLVIEGSDITADKTIIEEIKIPLMHIIRNAIDHGIEDVETRKSLGKNPIGKIIIKAEYKDNKVIIDVQDDGRGLDIEKIKQKALNKGLLTKEELSAISDEELTNLIFYPGFSTEDFVTDLSGRGLGLDIVNNKISQLSGRVDIFSQIKQGTIVRIVLPATVATKKVFIIEQNTQLFAIETSVIRTIVRINTDEVFEKDNNNYYIYNGAAIPIYTLSQILNFDETSKETSKYTLMIIETDSTMFGVIVEKLISDQEIVHKKLAPPLYKVKHISGITTLANGEPCLILSVADIINTITSTKIGPKLLSKNGIVKTRDNFKYKIIVVDDSHTTRILQKNILSHYGYNVSTATSPKNALEKLHQNQYDLIISDIQMPEMNGFEFISEVRKMSQYAKIPVIIVSSEPREKYEYLIQQTKIVKYIQKNLFKQEELIASIEGILNY